MIKPRDLIVQALLDPTILPALNPLEWDLLIRQGRRANLLGRLAFELDTTGQLPSVPPAPRVHLQSALLIAQRQTVSVHWEVGCIYRETLDAGATIILLKGAAYVMAGLPVSRGRLFSDIDILVPKRLIGKVEAELMVHGWQSTKADAYDQRYYREWMHELPPMQHVRRGTNIDVHHAIVPETARVKVNTPALFDSVFPVSSAKGVWVLQPVEMFLHSATHLFHEGEFDNGLRDLFDLDSLLRNFSSDDQFWPRLVPRARELGMLRPLFYALRYTHRMLGTPIPEQVLLTSCQGAPSKSVLRAMDFCYFRVLRPLHDSCAMRTTWLARVALFVRSHWLRMPTGLLLRHLAHKAFVRPKPVESEP